MKKVQTVKKVKFNVASAIELSDTADFVYHFVYEPYTSEQIQWAFDQLCL